MDIIEAVMVCDSTYNFSDQYAAYFEASLSSFDRLKKCSLSRYPPYYHCYGTVRNLFNDSLFQGGRGSVGSRGRIGERGQRVRLLSLLGFYCKTV